MSHGNNNTSLGLGPTYMLTLYQVFTELVIPYKTAVGIRLRHPRMTAPHMFVIFYTSHVKMQIKFKFWHFADGHNSDKKKKNHGERRKQK